MESGAVFALDNFLVGFGNQNQNTSPLTLYNREYSNVTSTNLTYTFVTPRICDLSLCDIFYET